MPRQDDSTTSRPPCIVLDGVFFQFRDRSGITRVWSSLLEQWAGTPFAQSLLVLDREGAVPKFPGIRYMPFRCYDSRLAAAESFVLEDVCRQHDASVFISTFYTIPLETPSVMMVHDMIPERFPGHDQKWSTEKRFSTYHASGYIAVSRKTAQDLHQDYPLTKDAPLCVAYNAVSANFHPVPPAVVQAFRVKYGIDKPYFLCVGRRDGHKNGLLFFRAFSRLPDKQDISILCCGGNWSLEPELSAYLEGDEVHMLSLSDEDLNAAYAGALALVYPSTYEGFGLPIIEAMAAGCPVITCPSASIPEVAEEAALYVDDSDADSMLSALTDIQRKEIREPLIEAGFQRSRLFSWSVTADSIRSFLTHMANLPAEAKRPISSRCWREFRSYEREYDMAPARLRDLLRRPELKNHIHGSSHSLRDLESAWLESIAEESRASRQVEEKPASPDLTQSIDRARPAR